MQTSNESIFVSAFRSLFKTFFAICGLFLSLFAISFVYFALTGNIPIEPKTTISIVPDAENKRELVSQEAPAILQIKIHGVIGDPGGVTSETIEDILIESRTAYLSNDRVKGIFIHFNTPGGTVSDSDAIYRMLKAYKEKYKIPIYAYVEGLCASGGMYIAASADKIYGSPTSVIGSVGVILGPFFNISETLGKIGVQSRTLTQGLDKDAMTPYRPWKEGEDASYKALTAYFYDQFVQVVTEARPRLDKTKLIHEYGAHVFDPILAQKYGYIDQANANRNEALLALLEEAKIDPSSAYQVVELQPKFDWMRGLSAGASLLCSGKVEHRFDFGQPKIQEPFAYLYMPN